MVRLINLQKQFFNDVLDSKQNACVVKLFCRALVVFTIVKIILIWNVTSTIVTLQEFTPSPSFVIQTLFFPAQWATQHIFAFYSVCIAFLVVILLVRWNYISGILFFLLALNLFRLNVSIVNGADYVLIMLSFWTIGMASWPVLKNQNWNTMLVLVFNVAVFCCQLQIAFIYLVSGWDKLTSEVWRSGDAISYITHLDFFFNQIFALPDYRLLNLTLSWITIVFELSFAVLIWIKQTRLIVLAIGVLFHLVIWFALSIPDFGLIMILSYMIFLKNSDLRSIPILKSILPASSVRS